MKNKEQIKIGAQIKALRQEKGLSRNKSKGYWANTTPVIDIEDSRKNYTIENLLALLNNIGAEIKIVKKSD